MYPVGSLKVFGLVLFLDSQCAHMYRPDSVGTRLFLDYIAWLAGLYMAFCAGVSPQIQECGW